MIPAMIFSSKIAGKIPGLLATAQSGLSAIRQTKIHNPSE
jgi:hypothetical protein